MFEISRDTMISEILANAPEAMPVFQNIGMHCLGCAMASGETLEQACLAHGRRPGRVFDLSQSLSGVSIPEANRRDQKDAICRQRRFYMRMDIWTDAYRPLHLKLKTDSVLRCRRRYGSRLSAGAGWQGGVIPGIRPSRPIFEGPLAKRYRQRSARWRF